MSDVTCLLDAARSGDRQAADLLPLVYGELRNLAAAHMSQEVSGHSLLLNARLWRSRPGLLAVLLNGVRPNSIVHITSTSSNEPTRFRF